MVSMPDNAPSAPAMPEASKKPILPVLVVVFALLGVIMPGASLAMTWYTTKVEGGPSPFTADENFNGYDTDGNMTVWSDMKGVDNSHAMYVQVQMLVLLGIVMSILLLAGGVMLMRGPKRKMVVAVLGILAIVFSMLGPVLFMARHAPAWASDAGSSSGEGPQSSFSGSTGVGGVKSTWGPSIGWDVALLGFVFTLLGAITVFALKGAPKGS